MRLDLLATFAMMTAGCSAIEQPSGLIPRWTTAYREVISEDDHIRLRDWRSTFVDALAAARKTGHGAEIDREGALLDPDAAIAGPAIPNGMYACRVIKLGAKDPGNLDFASYPGFTCRIRPERTLQRLRKLYGAPRYVRLIFPCGGLPHLFFRTPAFPRENPRPPY